jgi:hypothetical protein
MFSNLPISWPARPTYLRHFLFVCLLCFRYDAAADLFHTDIMPRPACEQSLDILFVQCPSFLYVLVPWDKLMAHTMYRLVRLGCLRCQHIVKIRSESIEQTAVRKFQGDLPADLKGVARPRVKR